MKLFTFFAAIFSLAAAVCASGYGGGAAAPASGGYGAAPVSIPAPPCPKNYLFSCAPNLSPAPCSPPAGGYGGAGAYSQQYPIYSYPQYINGYPTNQDEN